MLTKEILIEFFSTRGAEFNISSVYVWVQHGINSICFIE